MGEHFFDCIQLCFPDIYALIDTSRGYEVVKTALPITDPEGKTSKRSVDVLVKVWTIDGSEQLLYIHIEIQAQYLANFSLREMIYWGRVAAAYETIPISLVILIDDRPDWRPDHFKASRGGMEVLFKYPTVKLLDWEPRREELLQSTNVFAGLILAQLDALATKGDYEARAIRKFALMKSLMRRGTDPKAIRSMMKYIDWVLRVPRDIFQPHYNKLVQFNEENVMPFVSIFEEIGMEKAEIRGETNGIRSCLADVLELKFGDVGLDYAKEFGPMQDASRLRLALKLALKVDSIDELRRQLQ